jgi:hypothetical protein
MEVIMDRYHFLDEDLLDPYEDSEECEEMDPYEIELVSKYVEVTKGLKEDPLGCKWTTERIKDYLRESGYDVPED